MQRFHLQDTFMSIFHQKSSDNLLEEFMKLEKELANDIDVLLKSEVQ